MNFQKNLEAIKEINPGLASWIEKEDNKKWIQITQTKNEKKNLLIKKRMETKAAYPEDNPTKDCKIATKENIYFKDTATILIGIGLGHLAHAILKRKEKGHIVIIAEPISQLVQEAFKIYDFTKWIKNGTLYFASPEKQDITYVLGIIESTAVIQDYIIIAEKYIMWCEEYAELAPYAVEVVNQIRCNTGTIMGAGSIIAQNDISNLPYIIRHRGVSELENLYKDMPAILISTGPSLQKNIHLIREIQNKVIIIAVAQALRVLLAYDIQPDFICTVDYGEVNYEHFEGLMDSNVPLVALNRTYAPILEKWEGTKFIVSSLATSQASPNSVQGMIARKGMIDQGGSVSHMVMGLGVHLGCAPLIVVGQDLSYPDEKKSHISLVDAGGKISINEEGIQWDINDPRSSMKDDSRFMGGAVYVPGYFGEPVITNVGLASFITSFERMVESYKDITIYNATEGGADIKGTKKITLRKIIDTILKEEIDKSAIVPLLSPIEIDIKKEVLPFLISDIKILDKVIEYSEKGIKEAENILQAETKEELKKSFAANRKYSNKAHEYVKKNNLVGLAIYKENRLIHNRELKVKGKINHLLKNKDDLKIRVDRNKLILNAALKQSKKLKILYKETCKKLKNEKPFIYEKEIINLDDSEKYFEVENWAHPLLDARKTLKESSVGIVKAVEVITKAVEMKNKAITDAILLEISEERQKELDYLELIEEANKAGRENQNFEEALILLKKANTLFPKKKMALWGIATTYHHTGEIDKSIDAYDKLVKLFSNSSRFRFEQAQVVMQKDFDEGMNMMHEVLNTTSEFDYFFAKIGDLYSGVDEKKAIIAYEEYLKKYPSDYGIIKKLGEQYEKIGDASKANKLFKKVKQAVVS